MTHMAKSLIAMLPVVLVTSGLVACSTVTPPNKIPGVLPAGASEVTIAGAIVNRSSSVTCSPEGTVTTIDTGTEDEGTTSTVGSDGGLAAKSVVLRNVGGFSGSYWEGLGDADGGEVTMKGRTYTITGTAMGYDVDNPTQRKPENFSIRVAC
jgi:lipoprotein LpqH